MKEKTYLPEVWGLISIFLFVISVVGFILYSFTDIHEIDIYGNHGVSVMGVALVSMVATMVTTCIFSLWNFKGTKAEMYEIVFGIFALLLTVFVGIIWGSDLLWGAKHHIIDLSMFLQFGKMGKLSLLILYLLFVFSSFVWMRCFWGCIRYFYDYSKGMFFSSAVLFFGWVYLLSTWVPCQFFYPDWGAKLVLHIIVNMGVYGSGVVSVCFGIYCLISSMWNKRRIQ